MTKIKIDTQKVSNLLLPAAANEKQKIESAKNLASRVSMPGGENYWGDVISKLSDCDEKISKYINWLNDLNSEILNDISNNVESINSVKIEKVNVSNIFVK